MWRRAIPRRLSGGYDWRRAIREDEAVGADVERAIPRRLRRGCRCKVGDTAEVEAGVAMWGGPLRGD